jgi:hypothetical protein
MGLKIFSPGGVDQKSSDLVRDPIKLRDSMNIRYSINKEYEKRSGVDIDPNFSEDTYSDVVFIKSLGEYFFRNGESYYSYKNGIKRQVPMGSSDPTLSPESNISGAEYLKSYIFTHKFGQTGTYKYDGNSIYRAGLPVPTITTTQSGGAKTAFMYSFYDFIDNNGTQIFGPGKITKLTHDSVTNKVSSFKDTGFYQGYIGITNNVLKSNGLATSALITVTIADGDTVDLSLVGKSFIYNDGTGSARTITGIVSPNSFTISGTPLLNTTPKEYYIYSAVADPALIYQELDENNRTLIAYDMSLDVVVGNKIAFRSSSDRTFLVKLYNIENSLPIIASGYSYFLLEIESIVDNIITFTKESLINKKVRLDVPDISAPVIYNCMTNLVVRNYFSESETTGYVQGFGTISIDYSIYNNVINNRYSTCTYSPISVTDALFYSAALLSDTYDITTDKLRPPKCRYISIYGDQIVYGNVISVWNFENKETNYTNNDLVMYSDLSDGDLAENISIQNRQLIGDTYDGEITGLIRSNDSMLVFKTRAIYALDGYLIQDQYSVRKIQTNEIGCLSEKSIMQVEGAVVFQGQDGIYIISGNMAKSISTPIDVYMNSSLIDPSKTRSVMEYKNSNFIFFTNTGAVSFNYEYREWFIWDLTCASSGAVVDNDGNVSMFSGSFCKVFSEKMYDYNNGNTPTYVPINAWIKSAWFDLGDPSILKKLVDIRLFSLKNIGQILYCKIFRDWSEDKTKQEFKIDMSDNTIKTIHRKLDIDQAQSLSLIIGNNNLNEDMKLTGYELGISKIQTKDKNVK